MGGKTIFTAMKKLLFLGACLMALASQPVMAQTGGAQVAVVRLLSSGSHLFVTTTYGVGKTESVDTDVPLSIAKSQKPIAEAYQQVVMKLTQEGYTLKGMSAGDGYTTLIFMKGQ
jgi:hypothetical protein